MKPVSERHKRIGRRRHRRAPAESSNNASLRPLAHPHLQNQSIAPPRPPMAFRAFFVGINKHQDPGVLELTGAARDAQAFQVLFQDTFPDIDARLLVDLSAVIGSSTSGSRQVAGLEHERVRSLPQQRAGIRSLSAAVMPSTTPLAFCRMLLHSSSRTFGLLQRVPAGRFRTGGRTQQWQFL
jgi:hypothetical protein